MTYHKRPVQTRKCAHCRTPFESNHQSRLYCCQSCNTLAWRARHGVTAANGRAGAARPAGGELPFSARTVGVVAAGSAVGALAAQAGTYLAQQLWQGGTETDRLRADVRAQFAGLRADLGLPPERAPASFVPAAVRAATGPVRHLGPAGGPLAPFVEVPYHGHALYYCAAEDVLLWSPAPDTYRRVSGAPLLAALAATPPQRPAPALPPPAATAPRVAPRRAESAQPGRRLLRARADAEAALVGVARRQVSRARRRRVAQQRAARARSGLAAAAWARAGMACMALGMQAMPSAAKSGAAWAYRTDLRQQIGGACSLAHGLAAILLWPVMHTLFLIQEHARVNPPYHSVLVLLNRSIMYSEQRAARARLSASTTSLAVGRSAGSYSRQRCIRRSTAGGHSSGTLRGRQRSTHPQPAALCHAQQLRQSSPNCND